MLTRAQLQYRKHRATILAKKAVTDALNREKLNAEAQARRDADPEKARSISRKSHAKHRLKRNAYNRQHYAATKDTILVRHAQYLRDNPHIVSAYNRNRKARMRGAKIRDFTAQQWADMLEMYEHRCVYCGDSFTHLTQDHIVPLVKNGDHTWSNIVPSCQSCNARKRQGPP